MIHLVASIVSYSQIFMKAIFSKHVSKSCIYVCCAVYKYICKYMYEYIMYGAFGLENEYGWCARVISFYISVYFLVSYNWCGNKCLYNVTTTLYFGYWCILSNVCKGIHGIDIIRPYKHHQRSPGPLYEKHNVIFKIRLG